VCVCKRARIAMTRGSWIGGIWGGGGGGGGVKGGGGGGGAPRFVLQLTATATPKHGYM